MKTLSQVFDDIRDGKQKEICYTALICALAEGKCCDCEFTKSYKEVEFGCCNWIKEREKKKRIVWEDK